MDALLIVGASGHAKVVADIVERQGLWRVAGFIDATLPAGAGHFGLPVLGGEDALVQAARAHGVRALLVAIGDNAVRARVAGRLAALAPGLAFATAVHPAASIARGAAIGPGSVVMPGAVLGPDTRVGSHCIVNTGASLDHDGVLEDFASLGPGAALGGNVRVGTFAHVGLGASVIHGVSVGEHAVLGAGAVAVADVPARVVALGVPARAVRGREPGERYY
ncbi:acetyltransferase [Desulfocurvus sp.]|uniref:acetyltransferase n=1 Tax=Desulfocurvus sp. TaxID=2871698 RepID=UPI0025B8979D|nr:acetyltransferase [Desulfocurvus sp.]MCK9240351.1 acetyltransferase [Desulfocurvus sp.]